MGYQDTKAFINANIRQNGENAITGNILNTALNNMLDSGHDEVCKLGQDVIGYKSEEYDAIAGAETITYDFPVIIKSGESVTLIARTDGAVVNTFRVYANRIETAVMDNANSIVQFTAQEDVSKFIVYISNVSVTGKVQFEVDFGADLSLQNAFNEIEELKTGESYANNRLDAMPDCYGKTLDLEFESGYLYYEDGTHRQHQSYKDTPNLLLVNEGDIFVFLTDAGSSVAVVAAYDNQGIYQKGKSLQGTGTYMAVRYVVPPGIRKLRFTLSSSDNFTPFVTQVYRAKIEQVDSIDTKIYQKENIVLTSGTPVQLDGTNCHKTNWIIEANFRGLSGFTNILVGKGLNENIAHGGMWLNITPSTVAPTYGTGAYPGVNHGLTIGDYLDVRIESFVDKTDESEGDTGDGDATFIRYTLFDGAKQFTIEKVFFLGSEQPFVQVNGASSAKVNLFYWCTDLKNDLWCFGDSYFSIAQTRWPYWLLTRGYRALFNGMPGADSEYMWKRFCYDLMCGNPKKVFWCLGMNDPDNGAINSAWQEYIQRVIDICTLRGIEIVLCTIPNTPAFDNTYKNAYVRSLSYHYVDFDKAVKNAAGTGWIDGMMQDSVHPNKNGAKCLANAAMKLLISNK